MANELNPIERPLTTQQMVLAELRRQILTRRLRPGHAIRPDVMAAQLRVSRVPVREALKILEGEGQVIYRPHHGYFVAELDVNDLMEIYRLREILETEAVRNALPHLGSEELERMREAIVEMESLGDEHIIQMTAANQRFHFTLLEAAEMPHLLHHIRLLWDSTGSFRSLYYMDEYNRQIVNREHREILDAVSRQNTKETIERLNEHRRLAIDALKGILQEQAVSELGTA